MNTTLAGQTGAEVQRVIETYDSEIAFTERYARENPKERKTCQAEVNELRQKRSEFISKIDALCNEYQF